MASTRNSKRHARISVPGGAHRLLFSLAFVLIATCICAQEYPAMEGYVGFTAINNEYGTDRQNSPGLQMSFGYNLKRQLRLVTDFGFETHSTDLYWYSGRRAQANMYQFLLGPEFTLRQKPRFSPYVHALAGAAWRHYAVPNGQWICTGYGCVEGHFDLAQEAGFASALGGGLDWHVWRLTSVRVVQLDWIGTNLSRNSGSLTPAQGQLPTLQKWQNNYRLSSGVVFRFGSKDSKHFPH